MKAELTYLINLAVIGLLVILFLGLLVIRRRLSKLSKDFQEFINALRKVGK